jgi:hypothetical protein
VIRSTKIIFVNWVGGSARVPGCIKLETLHEHQTQRAPSVCSQLTRARGKLHIRRLNSMSSGIRRIDSRVYAEHHRSAPQSESPGRSGVGGTFTIPSDWNTFTALLSGARASSLRELRIAAPSQIPAWKTLRVTRGYRITVFPLILSFNFLPRELG